MYLNYGAVKIKSDDEIENLTYRQITQILKDCDSERCGIREALAAGFGGFGDQRNRARLDELYEYEEKLRNTPAYKKQMAIEAAAEAKRKAEEKKRKKEEAEAKRKAKERQDLIAKRICPDSKCRGKLSYFGNKCKSCGTQY